MAATGRTSTSKYPMRAIEIQHCQAGSVTSRQDGSVKISFVTPELRPSEAGALIAFHGKNCCVSIVPEDTAPESALKVSTERGGKTPSQRLHAVMYLVWRQSQPNAETFEAFYARQMEELINTCKAQLP